MIYTLRPPDKDDPNPNKIAGNSQLLSKTLLQVLKQPLFHDCILRRSILAENVVWQCTCKACLRVRGLTVRSHTPDAPSLRTVALKPFR